MPRWGTAVAIAVALAPALVAGAAMGGAGADRAGEVGRLGQQPGTAEVRAVWLRDCAVCHGREGRGTEQGPGLAGTGRAMLDYVLRTGRMPIDDPDEGIRRRPPAYDEATADALVEYAARLDDGLVGAGPDIPDVDTAAGDPAAGGEIWRLQCAACHRWSGDGGALSDDLAPDVRPADARELGDAVRAGPFAMPAFGQAALDDQQLDDLAAYVEDEIDRPDDRGGWSLGHIGPVAEGAVAMVGGLGALAIVTRALGTRERPEDSR